MIRQFFFIFFISISFHHTIAQQVAENSLRLLFLGDIMGHGSQIKAAYNSKSKSYNYDTGFQYIQPILSQADITIGNLEVTLGTKPFSGYPQFSSPSELAVASKAAGIDILATSNNHSCDRGKRGILKTISILDSLNISHLGTYSSIAERGQRYPLVFEKNNIKIALLNYTYGTNGIAIPKGTVVNLLDKETIRQDVIEVRNLQPDQIIAFVHWGEQYQDLPSMGQKKWFSYFKSLGVNIVIGSHPHVVQPTIWDKKENSLVVYSLGNFISNQRKFPRDGGSLFELVLTKKGTKTKISAAQYILTWVYKKTDDSKTDFLVLPLDEFEYKKYFFPKITEYDKMIKYAEHARNLFKKHNADIFEHKPFTELLMQFPPYLF